MSRATGTWGEAQVAAYLRKKGYQLLAHSFHCRFGEIDLIAQKGKTLCFVEVKTRKDERFAKAREFVTRSKQERLIKSALLWQQQNDCDLPMRFDVIEVVGEGLRREITHIENAFE